MKWLACFWAAVLPAMAQNNSLLSDQDALALERRTVQLIESTGLAVPGLARAGAPALEDARQALGNLETSPRSASNTYTFVSTVRAFLAIAETVPRPYPFPDEARRQFNELRDSVDRLEAHFRGLLDAEAAQLHNPDRDNLKRYAEADQKLGPPSPERPRVVFLGDSITDGWRLKEYYGSDRDFINRGISGQISGEMLGRMKADVIDLKPQAVVVLAGTNDLARGVPATAIENNLAMIADLAEAHHITPVFASLLPVSDYHKDANPQFARSAQRPPAAILEVNNWLKGFCERRQFTYVDYYSALVDTNGFLQADASDDGLHPNAKGYRLMAPVALAAIDRVTVAAVRAGKKKPAALKTPPAPKPQPVKAAETKPVPAVEMKPVAAKPAPAAEKKTDVANAPTTSTSSQKKTQDTKSTKKKGGIKAWLNKEHT